MSLELSTQGSNFCGEASLSGHSNIIEVGERLEFKRINPNYIPVSREDVAKIIAQWWAEYEADPSKFTTGPDKTGESSGEIFFRIARELGIANTV